MTRENINDATDTSGCENCTDGSCGICYRGRVSGYRFDRNGRAYPVPCNRKQEAAVDAYLDTPRAA